MFFFNAWKLNSFIIVAQKLNAWFKRSTFVFHWQKKVIQVWNNMRRFLMQEGAWVEKMGRWRILRWVKIKEREGVVVSGLGVLKGMLTKAQLIEQKCVTSTHTHTHTCIKKFVHSHTYTLTVQTNLFLAFCKPWDISTMGNEKKYHNYLYFSQFWEKKPI